MIRNTWSNVVAVFNSTWVRTTWINMAHLLPDIKRCKLCSEWYAYVKHIHHLDSMSTFSYQKTLTFIVWHCLKFHITTNFFKLDTACNCSGISLFMYMYRTLLCRKCFFRVFINSFNPYNVFFDLLEYYIDGVLCNISTFSMIQYETK